MYWLLLRAEQSTLDTEMAVRSVYQDSRDELNDDQELSDEIRRLKTHMTHVEPTRDEVREHRLTRWSYRSRCTESVRGR